MSSKTLSNYTNICGDVHLFNPTGNIGATKKVKVNTAE